MNRGLLRGLGPAQFVPSWAGGGDPSNDGKVLVLDSSQEGGVRAQGLALAELQYAPAATTTYSTSSSTWADADTTHLVLPAFVVPASGQVRWVLSALVGQGTAADGLMWGVAAVGASPAATAMNRMIESIPQNTQLRETATGIVTGLTPGASLAWSWKFAQIPAGTAAAFYASGQLSDNVGPAYMGVFAA